MNLLLWPRFKTLLDAQLTALRGLSDRQLIAGGTEPSYVVRRYGVLLSSLLLMNAEYNDSVLHEAVAVLHRTMLPALQKCVASYRDAREGSVFLVNSWVTLTRILREADGKPVKTLLSSSGSVPGTPVGEESGGLGE